jgi:hypothetical protein
MQWAVAAAATGIRVLIQVLLVDQVVARVPTTQMQQIFPKAWLGRGMAVACPVPLVMAVLVAVVALVVWVKTVDQLHRLITNAVAPIPVQTQHLVETVALEFSLRSPAPPNGTEVVAAPERTPILDHPALAL